MTEHPGPAVPPPQERGGWVRVLQVLALALVYLGAARIPLASDLSFQAYLFWPAAAVSHTAFFILGRRAWWGLALGSLLLNATGWLPWPHALAMTLFQTLGPLVAWRVMVRLGYPHPDLGRMKDLVRWLGTALLSSALFSACIGSALIGLTLPGATFPHPVATAFSWFLGDLTAILCLGPLFIHVVPGWIEPGIRTPPSGPAPSLPAQLLVAALCLLLLFGGRINPALSGDFRLALQFALVLPVLWMALHFGPRNSSAGVALLSLAFLAHLGAFGPRLPDEAFRFSQLHLLVLALAALVTSAVAEESRLAHLALEARDLQALRMEAVGTLAGGLVHEFNNQLTVVFGNLDRLTGLLPAENQTDQVIHRLEEAAFSLSHTVQQLKALSHQAPLGACSQSLREALQPFLHRVAELPDRIAFGLALEEDLMVCLDAELLNQTLQHLLANSLEAIPGEGSIKLQARREGDWVHLVLEDNGTGMSPETLRRACDPFFSTKPMAKGRGLGLSFAFSLARQMGGRLGLESQVGRGTRAELVFPLNRTEPAPPLAVPRVPRSRRILLADDEIGIRELTREFLEGEGFHVSEAADGQEAMDLFESDPQAWDLVILDLVMPRLGGAEVLSRMEALRPDLPALLISGYSSEAQPDLLNSPHRRFLTKPFRLYELSKALGAFGLDLSPKGTVHGE
ncbi:MAG TPA: ATP-binding protein [Geothrix sp.]|nr:ATP-binding protein [Geothrix sp.]